MTMNEELQKKLDNLKAQADKDRDYIILLEDKLEDLQRGSRKTNIEIKNVPKTNKETKEELVEMVVNLSKAIDCKVAAGDIKDIYRVRGKKEQTKNTPIIVELTSTIQRTEFLKMAKLFNIKHQEKLCAKHLGFKTNEYTPIFVSEQLTAKGARLYFLARDIAKTKSYKFCWTAYGRIYLRKHENSPIIMIKSEAQANSLMQSE
ncbi:hypothetical protein NE865_08014 [Phthorimaea operculella]|nr:hypothetical protein NE865_08014 [Phthorimaea operculella]